jgi:hypothetical protein
LASKPASRFAQYTVKLIAACFAGAALVWFMLVYPHEADATALRPFARAIEKAERLRPADWDRAIEIARRVEDRPLCHPDAWARAVLVRLRATEDALAARNLIGAHAAMSDLERTARRAVTCNPTDSYVWFVLYWLSMAKEGPSDRTLAFLDLSYRLAPREGLVARRRNPIAFGAFPYADAGLREHILNEFVGLVAEPFYIDAAASLAQLTPEIRPHVMERLRQLDERRLRRLAQALRVQGVEIALPGLPQRELRPWDR